MKQCTKCNEAKPLIGFYTAKQNKDKLSSSCKQCILAKQKEYKEKHPELREKATQATKKWRLDPVNKRADISSRYKTKYGITLDDYEKLLKGQNKECYICKKKETQGNKPLYVDHCHVSGKVRKLLCQQCNSGLGMFRDNPELLIKAADYIKEHNV